MKHYYLRVPIFLIFSTLLFYHPLALRSQCLCANGDAPQTITQQIARTILPVDDSTSFVFNKFDPSVGQLMCINVFGYVTGVVRMRLENDEIYSINYRVNYNRSDQIAGPGLSPPIVNNFSKNYGPYNLAGSDGNPFSGPDYISIGPDSVLKNKFLSSTVTNVTPYLGPGSVTFFYKLVGKTTVTGSVNYIFSVSSNDNVVVGITYNYCPTSLLASGMKEFSAMRKGNLDVTLNWTSVNEVPDNRYDVEVSNNGAEFRNVGTLAARTVDGSSSSNYEYPFHVDQAAQKLYFRVKQVTANGKASYSPVRLVSFSDRKTGLVVYPNPAVSRVTMQFDNLLKGNYRVELVNLAGQVVYNKEVSINHSNVIELEFKNPPASGVYYLRAKDLQTNRTYSGKLVVQQQ